MSIGTALLLSCFQALRARLLSIGPSGNFCILSSSHGPSTAAHEAGHYLFGEMGKDGKWHTLHHPWASSDPDKTPLMRDGGAGFKIQFDLALQARKFISKHHGAGAGKKK